ncbi:MAG: hypothetical protein HY465_04005 [Deltaproteobacteria bacterium]|nr:hypothetical protein [Deltaproteobacteria bacterium]
MERIERTGIIIAMVAMIMGAMGGGLLWGISIAWGAVLSIGGFRLWCILTTRFVSGGKTSSVLVGFAGFAKLGILGFVLWWTVTCTPIQPLAFLVGLSSIVASILWVTLRG